MINKFLFFPFSHITQNQLDTILAFFPSFLYLPWCADFKDHQILQVLYEQDKVHPFFSSPRELEALELKVEQYLAWAQLHKGNKVNLKLLFKQIPYFTNDTSVTAIKSQIKASKDELPGFLPGESALQQDMLFLKMAQLCDEQNTRIDRELREIEKNHDSLISTLRGSETPTGFDRNIKTDQKDLGAMMTRERISAWSRCMTAKGAFKSEDGSRPIFITTSEAVFDYFESNCKDVVNALDIDEIKVHENCCKNKNEWHHKFCDGLTGAIQGDGNRGNDLPEADDGCSLLGQIKICLFSGENINKIFNISDKKIPVCLIKLK